MILVTLGTQIEPFKRLLDYIENSKLKCKIVVQAGHTKYHSKKMDVFDFISYDEMEKLIKEADLIITHGGTGSIVGALKKGKKIIACARLEKYGEHVDNHQQELVEIFNNFGCSYFRRMDSRKLVSIFINTNFFFYSWQKY